MAMNTSYYEIGRKQRENEIGLAALKNGLNMKDVATITGLDDEKLRMLLIVAFFETTCPLNEDEEKEFQHRLQQELTPEELKKLKECIEGYLILKNTTSLLGAQNTPNSWIGQWHGRSGNFF